MESEMGIKAVVFDLGGTLIEYAGEFATWPDLEAPGLAAAHESLRSDGVPLPSLERFQMTGYDLLPKRWPLATSGEENLTVPLLLGEILATLSIPLPSADALLEAATKYERSVCAGAMPIEYGLEVVRQLRSEGYKLGLISNTMFSGLAHKEDLERFDLAPYFDSMVFSSDVNMWKPNPAPFQHVLEELGVEASAAVFIGDDPVADVRGGRRAGMYTIHLVSSNRFASPDGVFPDATIYSLQELPPILNRLNSK